MKVKQAIMIEGILGRTIPSDMTEQLSHKYLSESKGEYISIGEMDIIHFIRAFNKRERIVKDQYTRVLTKMLDEINEKELNG